MPTRRKIPTKKKPAIDTVIESEQVAYMTNKWSRTAVQPLLLALLTAAFFTAVATVLDVLFQVKLHQALALLLFLVALEGVYTTIWLHHPARRQLNHLAYRAAEFLVIVLILRLTTWYTADSWPNLAQLADYLKYPLLLLADPYFIISVVLLFLVWLRAITASHAFNELAIDDAEAYYFTLPRSEQEPGMKPAFSNRMEIVEGLFQQWIWGGVILVAGTAVAGIDTRALAEQGARFISLQRLNLPPTLVWALFVYFIAGLLLISQARLGALNARWLHEGAKKSPEVERSWHRTTTWLLLITAVIALFLPLGSSFAIGHVLQLMLNGIVQLFIFLSYLFLALVTLLIPDAAPQTPPEVTAVPTPTLPPATPIPTPPPTVTLPPDETAQMLFSSAFWAVTIVLSVMAVSFFLRGRGLGLNRPLIAQMGRGLLAWMRSLWQDVTDYAGDATQAIRNRWPAAHKADEKPATTPPWRFIRLNALSPREQIRYFYLSTVKRASEQGSPRQQGETPLEFAEELKSNWPEAEEEIAELTEAFLRARYSRQEIEKEDVSPVKQQWRQVKARLRRSSRP